MHGSWLERHAGGGRENMIQFVVVLDKINGHYKLANVTITAAHTSFSLYSQHNYILLHIIIIIIAA